MTRASPIAVSTGFFWMKFGCIGVEGMFPGVRSLFRNISGGGFGIF